MSSQHHEWTVREARRLLQERAAIGKLDATVAPKLVDILQRNPMRAASFARVGIALRRRIDEGIGASAACQRQAVCRGLDDSALVRDKTTAGRSCCEIYSTCEIESVAGGSALLASALQRNVGRPTMGYSRGLARPLRRRGGSQSSADGWWAWNHSAQRTPGVPAAGADRKFPRF